MEEHTLPPGIKAASVKIFALIRWPLPSGEIHVTPVACRLIRVNASATNVSNQQSTHGEGVISNKFGIQSESHLAGVELIVGIDAFELVADIGRLPISV